MDSQPIEQVVRRIATRADLREALREDGMRTRQHFDVVAERLEGHIRLLAEGQVALREQVGDLRTELKGDIARLDRRLMRVEVRRP